ncbi:hypothetical protein BH10PSE12_BH10PSE12_01790 [soil metagenome]
MLELLADAMEVPIDRRSALLGRFQHLQRLSLIDGINPGRGTAAEYKANHVLVIAVAFQMLQLGMTPERAVHVLKQNQERVRMAIGLAVGKKALVSPSMVWFDPAVLTRSGATGSSDEIDLADATFHYGGSGTGREMFKHSLIDGFAQRLAFISFSGTLWHIISAIDGQTPTARKPAIGPRAAIFLSSLREWFEQSTPDSFA